MARAVVRRAGLVSSRLVQPRYGRDAGRVRLYGSHNRRMERWRQVPCVLPFPSRRPVRAVALPGDLALSSLLHPFLRKPATCFEGGGGLLEMIVLSAGEYVTRYTQPTKRIHNWKGKMDKDKQGQKSVEFHCEETNLLCP